MFKRIIFFALSAFVLFLLNSSLSPVQGQVSPQKAFQLDLNVGGGMLGDPDFTAAFQPEVGFSYVPGKIGFGIAAGLLNFEEPLNIARYRAGFEDFTDVTGSNRWRTTYFSIGPRLEFETRLPFRIRGSLDLTTIRTQTPSTEIVFDDPGGAFADTELTLLDQSPGAELNEWTSALRPEVQFIYDLVPSGQLALNITAGMQYRLGETEFTYAQRDLSNVSVLSDAREAFLAFETAPVVERTASVPKTNFFGSVGIKIRFGKKPRSLHNEGIIHRDIASRNAVSAGSGDVVKVCPTARPYRCPSGECAASKAECPGPVTEAQDYNSSRSNKPRTRSDGSGDEFMNEANMMARLAGPPATVIMSGRVQGPGEPPTRNQEDPDDKEKGSMSVTYELRPQSSCLKLSTMQIGTNSQKAMRSAAQNHNSSRSNRTRGIRKIEDDGGGNSNADSSNVNRIDAQNHNSSRSNRTRGIRKIEDDGGGNSDADSSNVNRIDAQNHNSSRSNRTRGAYFDGDLNGDSFPDMMEGAAVHIRTSRDPDSDDDGLGDASEMDIELELSTPDMDEDGYGDLADASSFSLSTNPLYEGETQEASNPMYEEEGAANDGSGPGEMVQVWTYSLSALTGGGDMDEDGYGDLLQNAQLRVVQTGGRIHLDILLSPDAAKAIQAGRRGSRAYVRYSGR